ncbi:hypothetical protein IIE18_10670 [Pseudomonas sp. V1]|uniref:hypothetical protein n=1 Tax=Pseudomonas arcuscaelestis TaxID=2710591 RepID=UPI00193FFDE5|nr:hypothetical protein [Pseudomonas arcuscaelestis]MBM3105603.1 hypothetical protein [Pseudomonas arcuscaelestis]
MQQIAFPFASQAQPAGLRFNHQCPVQPMDHVVFTSHVEGCLRPKIRGRVMNTLRTSAGNWRCAIVLDGQPFPTGNSVNVYSHEGTFEVVAASLPATDRSH